MSNNTEQFKKRDAIYKITEARVKKGTHTVDGQSAKNVEKEETLSNKKK